MTTIAERQMDHRVHLRIVVDLGRELGLGQVANFAMSLELWLGLSVIATSDATPVAAVRRRDGYVERPPSVAWEGNRIVVPSRARRSNSFDCVDAMVHATRQWTVRDFGYRNPLDTTVATALTIVTGGSVVNFLTWLETRKAVRRRADAEAKQTGAVADLAEARYAAEIREIEANAQRYIEEARKVHLEAKRIEIQTALDILAYYDDHQPGHAWTLETALVLVRHASFAEAAERLEAVRITPSVVDRPLQE